jgi:hypothetical protein
MGNKKPRLFGYFDKDGDGKIVTRRNGETFLTRLRNADGFPANKVK